LSQKPATLVIQSLFMDLAQELRIQKILRCFSELSVTLYFCGHTIISSPFFYAFAGRMTA
jgi:hypothetical protein